MPTDSKSKTVDLKKQSIEIEPGVRSCQQTANGKLLERFYDEVSTTHEGFKRGLKESGNGKCLGTKTDEGYVWRTYQEVYDDAQRLGSALLVKGLEPKDTTFVGIYSANRQEWVVTEEALAMFSMVYVALYDTLGVDACSYIINQTEMTTVVCDTNDKVARLLGAMDETPSLKYIIVMDPISNNNFEAAQKSSVKIFSYADMLELGAENKKDPVPPTPDTMATICYTSGTTGNPKGVMLLHKNLIANTAAVLTAAPVPITKDDVHISYLPLAHMFERVAQVFILHQGASIGFYGGDVRKLVEDIGLLKPTIFITVPRLLNRIYDRVMLGVEGSRIKSWLFNLALSKKTALLKRGEVTKSSIWDKLVFSKVQNLLGGRLKFVVVAAAPLSETIMNFTRCAFGCYVMEGYGQTEATAAVSITLPQDQSLGHVGPPLPCNFVKLVDVPEMDYYAKDGKGELCIKGNNCMQGYYKEPEKTAEAIDEDGWVHSGDIAQWLPSGTLKIIDRRKHIFKLAQGEYLAPEKVENVYVRSPFVAQAFVEGRGLQTYPVAVIVPDQEYLESYAKKKNMTGTFAELCKDESLEKVIHDECMKLGKESGLKGFEQAKVIRLHPELFTVENGLLTPTFKAKRPVIRRKFEKDVDEMYEKGGEGK